MPKTKTPVGLLLVQWTKDKEYFTTDGVVLFCQICNKQVKCSKRYHITQHENTISHKRNVNKSKSLQSLITLNSPGGSNINNFYLDLCQLFVACNIPWFKVENVWFKNFVQKYCNKDLPHESTLRKNYLPLIYKSSIDKIRKDMGESDIWVCLDETTDVKSRYVCNLIVGKLSADAAPASHLLASKFLEKTNHATVARFLNESLEILWPGTIHHDRVRIFYSDAAAYMKKAAGALQIFYPNIVHVTCIAHALNLVCEVIRKKFDAVNTLISSSKKVFLKAPLRVQVYKERNPNLQLPPEPVLTRWGTWLKAAFFYHEHFDEVKKVVMDFDVESAEAIRTAQRCFKDDTVRNDLIYINANFKVIEESITKLECRGLPLTESLSILETVKLSLTESPGQAAFLAKAKLNFVLNNNMGIAILTSIGNILSGKSNTLLPANIKPSDVEKYKYAPITSCDVERSFSSYKLILSDRRQSLSENSLEQLLIGYCEAKNLN